MNKMNIKKITVKSMREIYQRNRRIMLGMFITGFILGISLLTFDLPKIPGVPGSKTTSRLDPYDLLLQIKNGKYDTFILVDIRSKKDFLKGHIKSAESFPLYDEAGESVKIDNTVTNAFKKQFKDRRRQIIIYDTYGGSIVLEEFGIRLLGSGIGNQRLAVGWNEWRHFRNLWLPESMWDTIHMDEYVSE